MRRAEFYKSSKEENQKTFDANDDKSNKSADTNDAWKIGASGSTGREKEKGLSDILMNENNPGPSKRRMREELSSNNNLEEKINKKRKMKDEIAHQKEIITELHKWRTSTLVRMTGFRGLFLLNRKNELHKEMIQRCLHAVSKNKVSMAKKQFSSR